MINYQLIGGHLDQTVNSTQTLWQLEIIRVDNQVCPSLEIVVQGAACDEVCTAGNATVM